MDAVIPYQPRKFLRASKAGAKPGDFVFLLGFPGQTMRYAPTSRLLYSQEVAVPADVAQGWEVTARVQKPRAGDALHARYRT